MLFKSENILDIGTAEFVNGLVIVTYYTEIAVFTRQQTHQLKLSRIGVLIFIHHNVTETVLIIFQHFRIIAEQFHRFHDQIIKIQCIIFL